MIHFILYLGIAICLAGGMGFASSVISLMPLLLAERVGHAAVTSALGINWAWQALAFLGATPVAGKINTHSTVGTTQYYG